MDILRNILGVLTSGVVRLVVAAGILALCYFFILKPILSTTDDVFDKAFKSTGLDQIGKTIDNVNKQVEREIRHSFKTTKRRGGNPDKLINCIQRANGNVNRIQRCTRRY